MTTIAYKDGIIAYDSQITRGDTITYDDYDKCIDSNGIKFFCSGAVADFQRFVDVYFGATPAGAIDVAALVLDAGQLWYSAIDTDSGLWKSPVLVQYPYAIGSGAELAFAAMDMGATAAEAVGIAAKRSVYTGGQIRTFVLDLPKPSTGA